MLGPLFGLALAVELCIAMLGSALKGISGKGAPYIPGFGAPRQIGEQFLTTYLFPFELASLLLLVAAIGAVVLARRRRGLAEDTVSRGRFSRPRSPFTGTMAEAAGLAGRRGHRPGRRRAVRAARRGRGAGARSRRGGLVVTWIRRSDG